jgi:hypothetical protein
MATATTRVEITAKTSRYESAMKNVQRVNTKTTQMIQESWLKAAGVIYGAIKAWDMLKLGARAEQERVAFGNIANSYGANVDTIIAQLKRASDGTVDTMTLINKAGTAMMMGIAPDKISKLMEIARATSRMTGQSVVEAFSDISLAVGRQSKMILDNLGIIVQVGEANEKYAKVLGKTATQLTDVEKKQAFLNAALDAGKDLMERLGDDTKTTAEQFQTLEAQVKDVTTAVSRFMAQALSFQWAPDVMDVLKKQETDIQKHLAFLKEQAAVQTSAWLGNRIKVAEQQLSIIQGSIQREFATNKQYQAPMAFTKPGGGAVIDEVALKAEEERQKFIKKSGEELKAWQYARSFEHEERMLASKVEYMTAWHTQQAEAIIAQKEWEHQAGYDHETRMLELKEGVAGKEYQITKNLIVKQVALEKYKREMAKQSAYQMLGDYAFAFQEMGKHSQTAFEIFKAFSVAQTVIKTYEAAMGAYAAMAGIPIIGPALGIAAAAAAVMAGMARVSAIMSTSPGTSTVSGVGGAVGTYPASPTTGLPVSTIGQTETKGAIHIHIEGDFIGDEAFVDRLVEKINDAGDREVFVN